MDRTTDGRPLDLEADRLGTVERTHDCAQTTLRFERRLNASLDEVWRALTEPAELSVWFGCPVEVVGTERIRIHFADSLLRDSRILDWAPPNRLAFEWDDHYPPSDDPGRLMSLVTFELRPEGSGTHLTLLHTKGQPKEAEANLGGWHAHLVALREHLQGRRVEFGPLFEATSRLYETTHSETEGGTDGPED